MPIRTARAILGAVLLLSVSTEALAEGVCTVAANKAMDSTVAATITLANATKYAQANDDTCDAGLLALEQQDGAAVTRAWNDAIDAQSICASDPAAQAQMAKLIASLHRRRLKISSRIAEIQYQCQ